MTEHILIGLASIIVLGIGSQWLAWRTSIPAILLLLISGYIAGPGIGLVVPDQLFGDMLLPLVSVSVAIILFDGGLSLRYSELDQTGNVVLNLVSIGVIVTWGLSSVAAFYLLDLNYQISVLLGAILTVTGPTVILPLLRHVKPSGRVGPIVKWEGIVIDPIGAILAVLVFEAIIAGGLGTATTKTIVTVFKSVVFGGLIGLLGAGIIILALSRHWIPDFLQISVTLMLTVAVFTLSNLIQTESGLLSVTVMGVALANQRWVNIKHIIEFKETLRVLLISILFIILAARLDLSELKYMINAESMIFLGILIFVIRPLAVLAATFMEELTWKERLFISWMAPRGIVAASVASVFALRLVDAGYEQAFLIVPITFMVISGTVTIYGLTASPVARLLQLAKPNPQGLLIIGAHDWAREMARFLHKEEYKVLLVDSNWNNISAARKAGLNTYYANILSEHILDDLNLDGIGRVLAITPNDEVNSLAVLHFLDDFNSSQVYQLSLQVKSKRKSQGVPQHLRGRLLFGKDVTYTYITERFEKGAVIKKTPLTNEFNYESFKNYYGDSYIPLFLIKENGDLVVLATDNAPTPQPGQQLVAIVDEVEARKKNRERLSKERGTDVKTEKILPF